MRVETVRVRVKVLIRTCRRGTKYRIVKNDSDRNDEG